MGERLGFHLHPWWSDWNWINSATKNNYILDQKQTNQNKKTMSFRNWITGSISLWCLREGEVQSKSTFTVVTHIRINYCPRCRELETKQSTVGSLRLIDRNKSSRIQKKLESVGLVSLQIDQRHLWFYFLETCQYIKF